MSTPARRLTFSPSTEAKITNLANRSNRGEYPYSSSISELKVVYLRGASASVQTDYTSRHESGMTRVFEYLGERSHVDDDLKALTASARLAELGVTIHDEDYYATPEHAIFAMTTYAGLGLDKAPAFRATWLRAVNEGDNPFERTKALAIELYSNPDADLLPKEKK